MKTGYLLAGGAVVAYLLFSRSTAAPVATPTAITSSGAPPAPAAYSQAYYQAYQYPAMLAANPNVGNPSYTLSAADASQYLANYTDLQQWVSTVVPKNFPNSLAALQYHWHTYGVPDKRTFLPLIPQDPQQYVPAPAAKNTSSGSWVTTALQVAGTVAAFAGDLNIMLNNEEVGVLVNGSAIGLQMLPLFESADPNLVGAIEQKNISLIKQYLS